MKTTRHKHLKLHQSKIDRAKKLLGAKTAQDTIEQALDLVAPARAWRSICPRATSFPGATSPSVSSR